MGFKTSSARRSSAQSAVASSIVVLPDTTGTGPTLSGSGITANTTINKQIVTVGQTATQGTTVLSGLTVSNVYVTDSSFNVIDDTALDPAGGYLKIIGTGFKTGCAVYLNGSSVTTTFVSSTELRVTTPASSVGTYNLMVFNSDGNGAIYLNLSVSNMPAYTTSAGSLGTVYETNDYTQSVVATGDAPLTYSLYSGTLPPNATLAANGVISGTSPVENSSNTYSFVVNVKDAQNQETTRSFSLTINTDVVTWSSPANNTTYSLIGGGTMANVTLAATSAAGKTITYTANTLPTGVSLSGNTIYGTPNTAQTVYTELTATAATTNRNAKRYISWNISLGDPYFNYVTLLLNGETEVTPFINDAGPNSLAPVITGDTRADSFSPYEDGYYSNSFSGASDYLTVGSTLIPATGDFTIEFWVYSNTNSGSNQRAVYSQFQSGSADRFMVGLDQTSSTRAWLHYNGTDYYSSNNTLLPNSWYHYVLTRSGDVFTIYLNGTQVYTNTFASASLLQLNPQISGSGGSFIPNAYISNLRIVTGQVLYTGAFTPPTSPLTISSVGTSGANVAASISGTVKILTCQSNRFVDKSSNAYTLTVAGSPKVTSPNPFPTNSSFATYGSAYFDGTGDYLTLSPTINIGTNDLTVEAWVYRTATPSYQTFFSLNSYTSGILLRWETTVFGLYVGGTGYSIAIPNQNGMPLNQWSHVALVRQSGVFKLYINGTQVYSFNSTYSFAINSVMIGRSIHNSTELWNGYIADARVVANTAVYTANTAPPSTPLTAIANTALLTLQTNGPARNSEILDTSPFNNPITRLGNASQGSFSPYSQTGWSNYFDGSGDYLTVADSPSIELGSSNFTIEGWFNWSGSTANWTLFYKATSYELKSDTNRWVWQINGGSNVFVTSWTPVVGQWYHIALVRNSTTTTLYINGTAFTSGTSVNAGDNTSSLQIGSGAATFNGFISNFRMVVGTALYTTTFTPSITPLTVISGTQLLTCQSNRFIDNSPNNLTITKNGDVAVHSVSPFGGTTNLPTSYSNYFDGSGDYLTIADSAIFEIGSSVDFTIEAWFYVVSLPSSGNFADIFTKGASGVYQPYYLFVNASGSLLYYSSSSGSSWDIASAVSLGTITVNTWYHVAISRQGTNTRLFLNGSLINTITNSGTALYDNTRAFAIGGRSDGTETQLVGNISNLRFVKGTAVYTSPFTPSTTPLTAIENTILLTCQNSTFKDNSTNNFAITVNGDTKPLPFNPFGNTTSTKVSYSPTNNGGSLYCLNTSSYLNTTFPGQVFGTGDFTVECWVYATAASHNFSLCGTTTNAWGLITYLNTLYWQFNGANVQSSSTSLPLNCWSHIAVSRVSGVTKGFINGTQVFSAADTNNYSATPTRGIGANGGTAGQYISDFRVTVGTGLYTSAFSPPVTPLTSTNNTTLLLNFTNGAIVNQQSSNIWESTGNAQLSTTIKKFGKSSIYFDGTNSRLFVPASPVNMFGTGDFTIEFWMNTSDTSFGVINPSSTTGSGYWAILVAGSTLYWQSAYNATNLKTASLSGYLNSTWVHIAIVRSSGVLNFYFNGTVQGTGTSDTTNYSGTNNGLYIGHDTQNNGYFAGYLDDIRITKGYARYTTNFTAPTAAFVGQ
jgi:hypothetical protein